MIELLARRHCLVLALVTLAGCERDSSGLAVFAASSLTEAFSALEQKFETANDANVTLTFAGSQVLRLQIEQGAPADVYASGDRTHMEALVHAGLARESRVFADNELVVIVPPDNPAHIGSFVDLPRAQRLVLGAETCPVGIYTERLLEGAAARFGPSFRRDVLAGVVSRESNVRLVRAKVELGEADAAIVYRTDAVSCDGVRVVAIPEELRVRAEYHIGIVVSSRRPELGSRWIELLESEAGQRVLEAHGFVAEP